jgi:hypothetical protein
MKLVGQTPSRYTGSRAFSRTAWERGRPRPPRRTAGACPGVPRVPPRPAVGPGRSLIASRARQVAGCRSPFTGIRPVNWLFLGGKLVFRCLPPFARPFRCLDLRARLQ